MLGGRHSLLMQTANPLHDDYRQTHSCTFWKALE